jgi:hypothetical protein
MIFSKLKVGDNDYADNIRIATLNGEPATWFFARPAMPALYLKPGENKLRLHAEWARGAGPAIKTYHSDEVTLTVKADPDGQYVLKYYIPEARYDFRPFRLPGSK